MVTEEQLNALSNTYLQLGIEVGRAGLINHMELVERCNECEAECVEHLIPHSIVKQIEATRKRAL